MAATKTSKTAPTKKGAKGTNGAGKSWKPGARVLFDNDDKPSGAGKGGTVKRHGKTTTGYQRGCRCDKCKAAMSAFNKSRRAAKKEAAILAAAAAAAPKITEAAKGMAKERTARKRTTKKAA